MKYTPTNSNQGRKTSGGSRGIVLKKKERKKELNIELYILPTPPFSKESDAQAQ